MHGADALLDREDEPTKDPGLQGGKRLDLSVGLAFHPVAGTLMGKGIFLDADVPLLQSLDGPQLQRRWAVRLGLQWEF